VTAMRVIRRGTLRFDGRQLVMDGWIVSGQGHALTHFEAVHEMRAAVFIDIARQAGVALEQVECDLVGFSHRVILERESQARAELERIRAASAPRRPWWRFWR
jgi:hypothetical protein